MKYENNENNKYMQIERCNCKSNRNSHSCQPIYKDCDDIVINAYMQLVDQINVDRDKIYADLEAANIQNNALDLQDRVSAAMNMAVDYLMQISVNHEQSDSYITEAINKLLVAYKCCNTKNRTNENDYSYRNSYNYYGSKNYSQDCSKYLENMDSYKAQLEALNIKSAELVKEAGDAILNLSKSYVESAKFLELTNDSLKLAADKEHEMNSLLTGAFQLRVQAYACYEESKVSRMNEYNNCRENKNISCCNSYIAKSNQFIKKSEDLNAEANIAKTAGMDNASKCVESNKIEMQYREDYMNASDQIIKVYEEIWNINNKAYNDALKAYQCCKGTDWYTNCECEKYLTEAQTYLEEARTYRIKEQEAIQNANNSFTDALDLEAKEVKAWEDLETYLGDIIKIEDMEKDVIYSVLIPQLDTAINCVLNS